MGQPTRRAAFTLVELLVVIVIVLLVSAVMIPAVIGPLSHRAVSESARILQAQLVQARDLAIRYNDMRGVRFLPDPTYSNPNTTILAYNRMVPLETAPEYSNGLVTIWPAMYANTGATQPWYYTHSSGGVVYFPPTYPASATVGGPSGSPYPVHPPGSAGNATSGQVIMIEQAPLQNNDASKFINAPTSWFWNVRVGDKIQINNTGQTYMIVGPCQINPFTSAGTNPELFVNNGDAGDPNGLIQRIYTNPGATVTSTQSVEFLLLVNGVDDDGDGYVDNGWDGVDNNQGYVYNSVIDDQGNGTTIPTEWEPEKLMGILSGKNQPLPPLTAYDTTVSSASGTAFSIPAPMSYTITRRPVPAQSAREVMFPSNVVVDCTSWNAPVHERSRLPIDPFTFMTDIMLLPSGQVVPTTLYSSPSSFSLGASFYHFWLSERQDVHELNELWGGTTNPNASPANLFLLPMPQDAYNAYGLTNFTTQPAIALTGERMLVTLFSRTGQVTTNTAEFFSVSDPNTPFYDSQLGAREAK